MTTSHVAAGPHAAACVPTVEHYLRNIGPITRLRLEPSSTVADEVERLEATAHFKDILYAYNSGQREPYIHLCARPSCVGM